jgi:hypothetical protein
MHVEKFILQIVEVVVIEVKASLEGTIGHPSLAFQKVDDLGEDFIEGHEVTLHSAGFRCFVPLRCHTFVMKGRVDCEETVTCTEGMNGRRVVSITR